MFKTKIFRNFVSFRINYLSEEFCFDSNSKQIRFVTRSKQNRERLGSSRVMDMLYTRAALSTSNVHMLSSHKFLEEDDDIDE